MKVVDVTEQRLSIKLCVALGKTPRQTAKMMMEAGKMPKVSR